MKRTLLLLLLVAAYGIVTFPIAAHLKNRPLAIKLGHMPEAEALRMISGDQRYLYAELAVVKVLFYFGTILEKIQNKIAIPPEYFQMYRRLETAAKLDPYNKDTYYFAQAVFTWEVKRPKDVNRLLQYGMKYRTWDAGLPFYIAFNSAYFLKDYESASLYMKKAAELSGDPLFANLAARYFYESGRTDLGIIFLDSMEKGAKDKKVKRLYQIRRKALMQVKSLTVAMQDFKRKHGKNPKDISELLTSGFIDQLPQDPYGGSFYITKDGNIKSTSEFAFGSKGENGSDSN